MVMACLALVASRRNALRSSLRMHVHPTQTAIADAASTTVRTRNVQSGQLPRRAQSLLPRGCEGQVVDLSILYAA